MRSHRCCETRRGIGSRRGGRRVGRINQKGVQAGDAGTGGARRVRASTETEHKLREASAPAQPPTAVCTRKAD
ncbi:hypothetical protein N9L68_05410 [bacterium]|nr:hypothetical protein [bacterium]